MAEGESKGVGIDASTMAICVYLGAIINRLMLNGAVTKEQLKEIAEMGDFSNMTDQMRGQFATVRKTMLAAVYAEDGVKPPHYNPR